MVRGALLLLAIAAACGRPAKDKGTGPSAATGSPEASNVTFAPLAPEVDRATLAVPLPPVPAFTLPALEPGLHSVKELRVDGERLVGQSIKVLGTITWIYDCAAAIGKPGESRAAIQKRIDADASQCDRPHLRLGSAADAVATATLWVVDVPKAPRPKLAVGDRVIVTGTWTKRSPAGFAASEGLLVFASAEPVASR